MADRSESRPVFEALRDGIGRRKFLLATTTAGAAGAAAAPAATARPDTAPPREVLQPGRGRIDGQHYLRSHPAEVRWGYVPSTSADPITRIRSGETITIDTASHEGILEDQGRDPVEYFGGHGVERGRILDDVVAIARDYDRTRRDFDVDGPHVVTGPVHVDGAEPGDVLRVDMLSMLPRVPYGVISSRHGKGALPRDTNGQVPDGIDESDVMPPVSTDGRGTGDPERYGNVSLFTAVVRRGASMHGVLPGGRAGDVSFPLDPFMGMVGVASNPGAELTAPQLNSVPPTLGGGNIDINLFTTNTTMYLPVFADGALFYVGDGHLAMGSGEVALTAVESSLRGTFRLTVCKRGFGAAPSVAHRYPFGETEEAWVPIGLSDPDGAADGQGSDLDVAMRRAVINALDFLEHDMGMDRAVAYGYLSAAADFEISQVVDKTVGTHGSIRKAHFRR